MTYEANSCSRDEALRTMASDFSKAAGGQPIDISIGGAALFVAAQCEHAKNADLDSYAAARLRLVADILQPQWLSAADQLPPDETPVLIVLDGHIRVGELRWDRPGHKDTYRAYRYWDDPEDNGQCWEFDQITHWCPLPQRPQTL